MVEQPFITTELPRSHDAITSTLSPREMQVAKYLVEGMRNCIIAEELGISVKTVDTHRYNVMKKLRVDNNVHLARIFWKAGIEVPE